MLADAVALLRCPHCRAPLGLDGASLRCEAGHSFDIARQGYASLLSAAARTGTADTQAMVAARLAFLEAGHYVPIADALAAACAQAGPGALVDVGSGPGWYLTRVLDGLPDRVGLALDVSKHALRRAARAHPRIAAVACDTWGPLPVRDAVAGAVLSVFAPRNPSELARVLAPGGELVLVSPSERHMSELIPGLGLVNVEPRKEERLASQLRELFERTEAMPVEYTMELGHSDVEALVAMGPSAHHLESEAARRRIASLPEPASVTASVTVARYRCV
jgi:23S rRNA (guanine745-N1)-methyltransferase